MLRKEDARDHDTSQFHYVAFDELTSFEEFQYVFLTSRVRTSEPGLPAIVRSGTNPGNIGHTWCKKRFILPAVKGRKIIIDAITKQKRIFIPSKLYDNPTLTETDPGYADRLKILPLAEQKAKLEGDWDSFSGQAFDEFRELQYPDEPPNLHVIPTTKLPEWWPTILACDWGHNAYTWCGWFVISPDNRVYLAQELFVRQKKIAEWATVMKEMCKGFNVVHFALDPSAWQDRGDPKTIAEQIEEHSGLLPMRADNDRISGRMLIHEYLRWQQKPATKVVAIGYNHEVAMKILRTGTESAYKSYLDSFKEQEPETNLPKLQIFKQCQAVIEVIKACSNSEKNPEDVEEFPGDDPYDGLRYGLKMVDFYTQGLPEERAKRERLGKILTEVAATNDQTKFYRQMELLDKQNAKTPRILPVFRKNYNTRSHNRSQRVRNSVS
jgi:hypothetical protein